MDDETLANALHPYDLQAPARMLIPRNSRGMPAAAIATLTLGNSSDGVEVKRFTYPNGDIHFQVQVQCDNAPHCHRCECETDHYATLTFEQIAKLKALLG